MFILFSLAGVLGGLLGGMGMGGGTVLIPILTIFLGVGQHTAQAVNLISFIPMSVIALLIHLKNKMVEFNHAFLIIISGVLTCILGCFLAKNISGEMLKRFFGGFLCCLSVLQIIMAVKQKN